MAANVEDCEDGRRRIALYVVVRSDGTLSVVELDDVCRVRWSELRPVLPGRPRSLVYHSKSSTVLVSTTKTTKETDGNGGVSGGGVPMNVLSIFDSENLAHLRDVSMPNGRQLSSMSEVLLGGRKYVVLVSTTSERGDEVVCGRDVDVRSVFSTVSLVTPLRRRQEGTNGSKGGDESRQLALSVAYKMDVEGRVSCVSSFNEELIAISVDNSVMIVGPAGAKLLAVVPGGIVTTPGGGAVVSMCRCYSEESSHEDHDSSDTSSKSSSKSSTDLSGDSFHRDGLLVGEMSSSLSLFVERSGRERGRMLEVWCRDESLKRGICRHSVSCGGREDATALFCDWATNTLRMVDIGGRDEKKMKMKMMESRELIRLDSHVVGMFVGTLLPLPAMVLGARKEEGSMMVVMEGTRKIATMAADEKKFLVVARDGSIVQVSTN